MKIKVYKNPLSLEVIAEFKSIEDLTEANETNNWNADQVEINGLMMLGWDEIV